MEEMKLLLKEGSGLPNSQHNHCEHIELEMIENSAFKCPNAITMTPNMLFK